MTQGPNVAKFALAMESTVEQVLEWANGQINNPLPFYAQEYPKEEDRMKAIKSYMKFVIEYNV